MKITVDRTEDDIIICQTQNGENFELPKHLFPTLKEGDIITASVDNSATDTKKEEVNKRLQNLFNK